MARRKMRACAGAVLLGMLVASLGGCTWFTGSESDVRVSPYLRELSITPQSVIYGELLTIRFRYNDPQNDIHTLFVTFQNTGESATLERQVVWDPLVVPHDPPRSGDLDLRVKDRATYYFSFTRGAANQPPGSYMLSVELEDRKGHRSNVLSGTFNLQSF